MVSIRKHTASAGGCVWRFDCSQLGYLRPGHDKTVVCHAILRPLPALANEVDQAIGKVSRDLREGTKLAGEGGCGGFALIQPPD